MGLSEPVELKDGVLSKDTGGDFQRWNTTHASQPKPWNWREKHKQGHKEDIWEPSGH